MNNPKVKHALQYIKKYADEFGGESGPSGPASPSGYADIKNMQKAIQEFADAAVKYKTIPVGKDAKGKPKYTVSKDDKRRDFNDFLAEQFMANADIHGDEYSTSSTATTRESKLPTDIVQLDNVIDSLRKIGGSPEEKLTDGKWDWRTNNALRNVYAFAAALVAAHDALGDTGVSGQYVFTSADMSSLAATIPPQKDPVAEGVKQEDLKEKAKTATPLIKKLTEFYNRYSSKTLDHPAYKQYINQDAAMYTFKPGGTSPYKADPKDPVQVQVMDNPASFTLPRLFLKDKTGKEVDLSEKITLDAFQTTSGIMNLMTQYLGYTESEVNNPRLLTQVVRSILAQVKLFIDLNNKLLASKSTTAYSNPYNKNSLYTYSRNLKLP